LSHGCDARGRNPREEKKQRMLKETERFAVRAEDGREFTIVEHLHVKQMGTWGRPRLYVEGPAVYETENGLPVTYKGAGEFEIVLPTEMLRAWRESPGSETAEERLSAAS
jgi:hypothetical protein